MIVQYLSLQTYAPEREAVNVALKKVYSSVSLWKDREQQKHSRGANPRDVKDCNHGNHATAWAAIHCFSPL